MHYRDPGNALDRQGLSFNSSQASTQAVCHPSIQQAAAGRLLEYKASLESSPPTSSQDKGQCGNFHSEGSGEAPRDEGDPVSKQNYRKGLEHSSANGADAQPQSRS